MSGAAEKGSSEVMSTLNPIGAALQMQREAAAEGFDWRDPQGLWDKLAEEIDELKAASNAAERTEELGDLLFMVLNIARHLDCDPVEALAATNRKFALRWAHITAHRDTLPTDPDARLQAMEALWIEAKHASR